MDNPRDTLRTIMAGPRTVYHCTECDGESPKWQGPCPQCYAWNTLAEALAARAPVRFESVAVAKSAVTPLSAVEAKENQRITTDLAKFDRVLRGGLVAGDCCPQSPTYAHAISLGTTSSARVVWTRHRVLKLRAPIDIE